MVRPDQFKEHQGRLHRPGPGGGNHHHVAGMDPLDKFFSCSLDAERKTLAYWSREEKRVGAFREQDIAAGVFVHISATSSDWQEGHMGLLPIPLNRSPHSLHR
jgi:hypothetical protein